MTNDEMTTMSSVPDAPASGGSLPSAEGIEESKTAVPEVDKKQKAKTPSKRKTPPAAGSGSPPSRAGGDSSRPAAPAASSPKRRKMLASVSPSTGATSSTGSKKISSLVAAPSSSSSPPVPHHRILVVDNGGDTVKYGWSTSRAGNDGGSRDGDGDAPCPTPSSMPNLTARLPQQWTVLVGDQLLSHKFRNPNSLLSLTRSTERGVVTNLGNQLQVWKRMLDLLRVSIPLHTDTAKAFGWKAPSTAKNPAGQKGQPALSAASASTAAWIPAGTCAVLLTVPPLCPRTVLDQMASVWLNDFGFARVGFACASAVAAVPRLRSCISGSGSGSGSSDPRTNNNPYGTACVVDVGWSATHVVPVVPLWTKPSSASLGPQQQHGEIIRGAVRRLPLGGRHLINLWKYQTTYRQWNLMDQEFLLKDVLEQTCEVAADFDARMKLASRVPAGKRPYDREYVLPDFVHTFRGEVRLPLALLRSRRGAEANESAVVEGDDDADNDDEDDSDVDDEEMNKAREDDDEVMSDVGEEKGEKPNRKNDDSSVEEEDDAETPDQIRRRILKQKEEEERRRREEEAEQQVLNLSVEQFAIPEALFRPSDVGLPAEWAGLPQAIAQSIHSCPKHFQPALYQSIYLVGGISKLPGLKDRLERELRALAPCDFDVAVVPCADPIVQAWQGARQLVLDLPPEEWSVGREPFMNSSSKPQRSKSCPWKGLSGSGGYLV